MSRMLVDSLPVVLPRFLDDDVEEELTGAFFFVSSFGAGSSSSSSPSSSSSVTVAFLADAVFLTDAVFLVGADILAWVVVFFLTALAFFFGDALVAAFFFFVGVFFTPAAALGFVTASFFGFALLLAATLVGLARFVFVLASAGALLGLAFCCAAMRLLWRVALVVVLSFAIGRIADGVAGSLLKKGIQQLSVRLIVDSAREPMSLEGRGLEVLRDSCARLRAHDRLILRIEFHIPLDADRIRVAANEY